MTTDTFPSPPALAVLLCALFVLVMAIGWAWSSGHLRRDQLVALLRRDRVDARNRAAALMERVLSEAPPAARPADVDPPTVRIHALVDPVWLSFPDATSQLLPAVTPTLPRGRHRGEPDTGMFAAVHTVGPARPTVGDIAAQLLESASTR